MADNDVKVNIRASARELSEATEQAKRDLRALGLAGGEAGKALSGAFDGFGNALRAAKGALSGYGAALVGAAGAAGLGALVSSSIESAGALNDLSQKTGVSAETLSAFSLALKASDVTQEDFAKGLNQLNKNIDGGSESFKRLGISTLDASGKVRSTEDILLDVAEAFSKSDDGAAKAAIAQELFGKAGADLIPLLNNGRGGLEKFTERAKELGLVISGETAAAADEFGDRMAELKSITGGVVTQVAAGLLPALNDIVGAFSNVNAKSEGFNSTGELIGNTLKAVAVVGLTVATVIETIGGSIVTLGRSAAAVASGNLAEAKRIMLEAEAFGDIADRNIARANALLLGTGRSTPAPQNNSPDSPGIGSNPDANKGNKSTAKQAGRDAGAAYLEGLNEQLSNIGASEFQQELAKAFKAGLNPDELEVAARLIDEIIKKKDAIKQLNAAIKAEEEQRASETPEKKLEAIEKQISREKELLQLRLQQVGNAKQTGQLTDAGAEAQGNLANQRFAEQLEPQIEAAQRLANEAQTDPAVSTALQDRVDKMRQMLDSTRALKGPTTEWGVTLKNIGENVQNSLADGLADSFVQVAEGSKTAKQAFMDFARSMLAQIAQMIVRALVLKAIQATLNSFGGGGEVKAASGGLLDESALRLAPGGAARANFIPGGNVRGPGGGTSDSIPAWLSNGEFVIRADSVRKYGTQFMHALNGGTLPQPRRVAFADGGLVGDVPSRSSGAGARVIVNIENKGPPMEAQGGGQRQSGVDTIVDFIIEKAQGRVAQDIRSGGPVRGAMQSMFGLNPAVGATR